MNLQALSTERRNPATMNIDEMDTLSLVQTINNEDKKVALAVEKEIDNIAKAIDEMSKRFAQGGRIIYCGAGTSGRMGVLDGVELTPTYNVPATRAFGIIAGGEEAMYVAVEGAEDSKELALEDMGKIDITDGDIVIGIAASGRTPYTISALEYANKKGALTISVTCNEDSEMNKVAQIGIAPVVGPEVVTGSTRMKAGTAQKMVLNMLSTGTMIKTGKVYSNLMINVQATNDKLIERSINIISDINHISHDDAKKLFEDADNNIATAIVMHNSGSSKEDAIESLENNNNLVKVAIKELRGEDL